MGKSVARSCWRKVGICGVVGVWENFRIEVSRILFCCNMWGRAMFRYIVSEGWDGKYGSCTWLLKRASWIVCPIIVCDGNNCSAVVIGVCG